MSVSETVIDGTLKADGTLQLDHKPNLSPGRVTVVLQQKVQAVPPPAEDWWQHLHRLRAAGEAAGYPFMNEQELKAHMEWLRAGIPSTTSFAKCGAAVPAIRTALMVIYCDSMIVIYLLDTVGRFQHRAAVLFGHERCWRHGCLQ